MNSYFDEAFRSLDFLTEEAFNLDDEGMKEMGDFIEDDDNVETVNVIDPDAETDDDIQDDYVGKVILNCVVCHSNMFEDKGEIEIDEGDTVANVGKECPFCSSRDGFKICGKVVSYDPFKDDEDEDEDESEEEVEIKDDDNEEEVELKDKEREGDDEVEAEEEVRESLNEWNLFNRNKNASGFDITGATLLSIDEVEKLPAELRKYNMDWWLRSPSRSPYAAALVRDDGIVDNGIGFRFAVRPALKISNLNSSNLKIGDTFEFGGKSFQIISDNLAFCLGDIGEHCFRRQRSSNDKNDYEKSDIKKYVDNWFKKALSEWKKNGSADTTAKEESLSHHRMLEKLAKRRMGMRECNKGRKVKEDYDETDADEYDHYEDEDEEDVSPRIHREMNRIQRMHDRNAHDIQVEGCKRTGKRGLDEILEEPSDTDHPGPLGTLFPDHEVVHAESYSGRRKTDKKELDEEDGGYTPSPAATVAHTVVDAIDRTLQNPPVFESSRRDDIDADADDRKEYAKAKFDKIEDDADSDRDYRLKHPKYKGELPRKHKKFDEDFRRVEIETDDETMEMDTKDDGGVTVTTTPKTEPTEEETAEVETTVDEVEVGGEETDDTVAELSDEDKEEILNNSEEEEEKVEAEEEAPAEETETTEVDAEEIKEESFDYVCGKYLKETYSNVKDFKSTCAREKNGKLVIEGVISFTSGARKNTSFIFEAYRATKSGRLKFLGENVEITPNKKAFTLTAVAKNNVLIAESLSYRYLQEGKRVSGICRVIK